MRLRHLLIVLILAFLPALARGQGGQVTLLRSSPEPLPNCTPAVVGTAQPIIWDITAAAPKYCSGPNTWATWTGGGSSFYQTVLANATAQAQEAKLNLIQGTNMVIACTDNAALTRTDCTFTASSTAATAFSALTPATNNTAGTYAFSGNTFDLTNATAFNLPKAGVGVPGATSGSSTLSPPLTGTFSWTLPAGSGTFAVSALSPISINPAGQIQCLNCNTSGATVTSVGLTQTGSLFNISGSPVVSAGNLNLALASQAANLFLASPNGISGVPVMRAIVGGDLPAINLAIAGAGGVTGLLGKANNLATAIYSDQANTYTAGIQSFAGAAAFIPPISTSFAPTASGSFGYNSTTNTFVAGQNGTTITFPWIIAGTPVAGQCPVYIGTGGQLGTQVCGTGGGGTAGTINNASQYAFSYYSSPGSANTLSGVAAPATNGLYLVEYNISGGLASAPVVSLPGIQVRTNTTLASDLIAQTDRITLVNESRSTATAVTGPALTSNIAFALYDTGLGNVIYTPSTGQVNGAASQLIPSNWMAFHYTDGSNAFMPVMPTLAAFPNAPSTPLFFTAATGTFSTGVVGVPAGGTGLSSLTAHALFMGEGVATPSFLGPTADAVPLWQSATLDPIASVLPNCAGTTNAITYNTTTHLFGCNLIASGGGGTGGQVDYPISYQTRLVTPGATLTAANTVQNTVTATTLFGTYVGRASIPATAMLPSTYGIKTMRLKARGIVSTGTTNFGLTLTISLGGVTLGTITVPTIASLSSSVWELDYTFGVTGITTGNGGGCVRLIGTSSAELMGCASSGSITGLNFASLQAVDVKATWGTAAVANVLVTNQLTLAPEQQL